MKVGVKNFTQAYSITEKIFQDKPLSMFYVSFVILEASSYSLYDVYKINEFSETVEIREYAKWIPPQGLSVVDDNMWERRSDLKGHHLR